VERIILIAMLGCLAWGCKSEEPRPAKPCREHQRTVDVDVSRHSVDVRVSPEDEEDVDVHVSWP